MLVFAQEENPGQRVLVKTHPETQGGHREGHFTQDHVQGRVRLFDKAVSPWALFEGATAVYTVSSQMGFEAIYAGHKPHVFGQPFYSGWGLTVDRNPVPRRERKLTRAQLFAAAMILYPTWYDPYRDQICEIEDVLKSLESLARAWREDRHGWAAAGMRPWKKAPLQKVFGTTKAVVFTDKPSERPQMVWASKDAIAPSANVRIEDGFLRSRGLGADLIPPLSLVLDDLGIYYDPTRVSRLDRWIEARAELSAAQETRAWALQRRLKADRLSKYNLGGGTPSLPEGHRLLVPGQVEDDASIKAGTGLIKTNLDLIRAAREENPDATVLYKPHPDVEAGLRAGVVAPEDLAALNVTALPHCDPMALLDQVQEVWTMTSLLGFEALVRDVPVTCLGSPFYAGWGLTTDAGPVVSHRKAEVPLLSLIHAVLIDYPRYFDPKTGMACPVEVVMDRLRDGDIPRPGLANRTTAKLQGWFAGYAHLWRR